MLNGFGNRFAAVSLQATKSHYTNVEIPSPPRPRWTLLDCRWFQGSEAGRARWSTAMLFPSIWLEWASTIDRASTSTNAYRIRSRATMDYCCMAHSRNFPPVWESVPGAAVDDWEAEPRRSLSRASNRCARCTPNKEKDNLAAPEALWCRCRWCAMTPTTWTRPSSGCSGRLMCQLLGIDIPRHHSSVPMETTRH